MSTQNRVKAFRRTIRPTSAAAWSAEEFWAGAYTWDGEPLGVNAEWGDAEIWSGADNWGGATNMATRDMGHSRKVRVTGLRVF